MSIARSIINILLFPHELMHYIVARLLKMEVKLLIDRVKIINAYRYSRGKMLAVALAPAVIGTLLIFLISWQYQAVVPLWVGGYATFVWLFPCHDDLRKAGQLILKSPIRR